MDMKVGDQFHQDFDVSESIYKGFIEVFSDRNELHTDRSFAQSKGFESEVMHGNILNGFLSYFVGECLPIRNVIIHSQSILFSKPVYMGNRVTLLAQISDLFESVGAVEFKFQFQNSEKVIVAKGKIQVGII